MSWELIIIISWVVIGIFNYGMTFGHFQNHWSSIADIGRTDDIILGIFCGMFGPATLLAFLAIKIFELYTDDKKLRLKNIKFW